MNVYQIGYTEQICRLFGKDKMELQNYKDT